MLAYNLMNLFKELVLGQRDKKRMGKWKEILVEIRMFFVI
jgi:hypothetical protein